MVDDPTTDGFASVSKTDDETRWRALGDADEPIITQVDDGRTSPGGIGLQPSSSCSQPSLVAAMLDALEVHPGHRVLEIGTGTGWNAALLSERVGPSGHVVSVEIDNDVARNARSALEDSRYSALVVTADGMAGYPAAAPYDRVLATASVRRIPRAWLDQTCARGAIVTPWGTDYCNGTLLRLNVHDDGSVSGRCGITSRSCVFGVNVVSISNRARRSRMRPTEPQRSAETGLALWLADTCGCVGNLRPRIGPW